ncbi:hypothetical protein HK104_003935 [Borealophlyctis nickersoniae]|nr:hypothetical protein HK104_003935 [Borealophlyctis nickersoniae]
MFCSLSGEPPETPVVSKKSGQLFEKRLILKYIADNGRDPVTGEELSADDLVEVKFFYTAANKIVKPRPPAASSVPNLLMSLQNEWDAVVLETYTLKQQYQAVRQELSRALYETDAAKRVIARLVRERDEARTALANVQASYASAAAAAPAQPMDMDVDVKPEEENNLAAEHVEQMAEKAKSLQKARRKRQVSSSLATKEEVGGFAALAEIPALHPQGVTAVNLLTADVGGETREWIVSGGKEGKAAIVDWRNGQKVLASFKAAAKKINDVEWRVEGGSTQMFTASADKTVKCINVVEEESGSYTVETEWTYSHGGEVAAVDLHPTGSYLVSAGADSAWCIGDVATGKVLAKINEPSITGGYTAASFHPDGLILGTGTGESLIHIWDVKTQTNVRSFEGHIGKITSLAFSENGYYLATSAAGEGVVKMWDLRNLSNFHTIEVAGAKSVSSVKFDYSGQFLAVGCNKGSRIYKLKTWDELAVMDKDRTVAGVAWGPDAKYLVTGASDRKLVVHGVTQ